MTKTLVAWPQVSPYAIEEIASMYGSGVWVDGPCVEALEGAWSSFLGGRGVAAVSNGTTAIALALIALGVGPGDRVVVPAFSFSGSVYPVLLAGAIPVFCDVDPYTFCVEPSRMAAVAVAHDAAAVIPVHLHGYPVDIASLRSLLPSHVRIVEDACQAHGTIIAGGMRAGMLGDAGAWSLNQTKMVPGGEGGLVTFRDADALDTVRSLRVFGERMTSPRAYVSELRRAGNFRIENAAAILARYAIPFVDSYAAVAGESVAVIGSILAGSVLHAPPVIPGHSFQKVRIRGPFRSCDEVQAFVENARAAGISVATWQHVALPYHPAFADGAGDGFACASDIPATTFVMFDEQHPVWAQPRDVVVEQAGMLRRFAEAWCLSC